MTVAKLLTSSVGAGRPNVGKEPNYIKRVYDAKIPLNKGGYDRGGAYWGLGDELRVSYSADGTFVKFYRRATSQSDANKKERLQAILNKVTKKHLVYREIEVYGLRAFKQDVLTYVKTLSLKERCLILESVLEMVF